MKKLFKYVSLAALAILIFPVSALAHQPVVVNSRSVEVTNPEISKAYYGYLNGLPNVYNIESGHSFSLYVNILVPYKNGQLKDVSVKILRDNNLDQPVAVLDAATSAWKTYFEPFGHDVYWMGPEYKSVVPAGTYQVIVTSTSKTSQYSLAIGEKEAFSIKEALNSISVIANLKINFFNKSPLDFILSPLAWGYIVSLYFLAFLTLYIYRKIMNMFASTKPRKAKQNIGNHDKHLRLIVGSLLLGVALTTTWSPILIFFSGICFFEVLLSWCGFYVILGRNTCPRK